MSTNLLLKKTVVKISSLFLSANVDQWQVLEMDDKL